MGLSENPEIQILAEMVMNLQLFDHIIGSKGRRYVITNYFSNLENNFFRILLVYFYFLFSADYPLLVGGHTLKAE